MSVSSKKPSTLSWQIPPNRLCVFMTMAPNVTKLANRFHTSADWNTPSSPAPPFHSSPCSHFLLTFSSFPRPLPLLSNRPAAVVRLEVGLGGRWGALNASQAPCDFYEEVENKREKEKKTQLSMKESARRFPNLSIVENL